MGEFDMRFFWLAGSLASLLRNFPSAIVGFTVGTPPFGDQYQGPSRQPPSIYLGQRRRLLALMALAAGMLTFFAPLVTINRGTGNGSTDVQPTDWSAFNVL